jgi:hypothetical protein
MITDAQKYLIQNLYEELGMDYDENEIDTMTKREASETIQELLDMKVIYDA